MWRVYGQSNTGLMRADNQDYWLSESLSHSVGPLVLCGVADGVGGHQAGHVASKLAVSELFTQVRETLDQEDLAATLRQAFRAANDRVYRESHENALQAGMGTTLTAALIGNSMLHLCHVGDSRAYMYHDGEFKRLTSDHSVVQELLRQGKITTDDADNHPQRNVLTKAMGISQAFECDYYYLALSPGARLLLCTDGLTRLVPDSELATVISAEGDSEDKVQRLMDMAIERGAPDNVTIVMVVWEGCVEC